MQPKQMSLPFPESLPADDPPMIRGTFVDGHRVPQYCLAWSVPSDSTMELYPDCRGHAISWWSRGVLIPWVEKYQSNPAYKSKIGYYFQPKYALLLVEGEVHFAIFITTNRTAESLEIATNQEYRKATKEIARIPDHMELKWMKAPKAKEYSISASLSQSRPTLEVKRRSGREGIHGTDRGSIPKSRCLLWEAYALFSPLGSFANPKLDKTNRTGNTFQLINGVVLVATFFSVRLMYCGYTSYQFFQTLYYGRNEIPPLNGQRAPPGPQLVLAREDDRIAEEAVRAILCASERTQKKLSVPREQWTRERNTCRIHFKLQLQPVIPRYMAFQLCRCSAGPI
ncbi:hypothetical protein DFH09DRAFT_1272646 [Mycena vulgaris]|nr:hypothetical protein DFH09DRAFT_1272646 [Mycena vulgaris]